MALYTVNDVVLKVHDLLEESTDVNVISAARLIKLTSDAQKWVAAESGCYQSWGTITLLASTVRYSPPTGASAVLSIEYNYGNDVGVRPLIPISPDAIPHAADSDYPYFWAYRGNYVSIYPSIPSLPDNATLNVLIAKLPDALTALTDSLVIPDDYQMVVPYYVAKEIAIKDNQLTKAQWLVQEIMRYTKEGIAQYSKKGIVGVSTPAGTSGNAN